MYLKMLPFVLIMSGYLWTETYQNINMILSILISLTSYLSMYDIKWIKSRRKKNYLWNELQANWIHEKKYEYPMELTWS